MGIQSIVSWLLVVLVVAAGVWLRWRRRYRRLLQVASKIPGPTAFPLIGNALLFMGNPEEFIRVIYDLTREYGDVFRVWLGPDLNVIVSNPDDLKILLSSTKTSVKGPQYKYMTHVIGGGILSGSGPAWRKHRKIATPNYGKRAIEGYTKVFHQEVDLLVQELRSCAGSHLDLYQPIVRTTSYTVCRTLMGLSKEQTMNLPHIQKIIDETPKSPKFTWFIAGQFTLELMRSEEDALNNTELSVIDRFILSQELNSEELLKETFTIFTSSQEASAKIASFTLLMMAYHPDCQQKLYAEIKSVMGDNRHVSDEDLKQMPYLDMVFKEVLRLFPIGALLQRSIAEDISISAGSLPAGCSLVVPIYHLHRDPRYWERPDDFDPERFTPENVKTRHPYSYIPFSLGPMDCLGRYFGTKLVKTICIKVLQEFEVTSDQTYKDLKIAIAISVVSPDGFYAKLKPRK